MEKEKHRKRNPIALREIGILAAIFVPLISVGFFLLNSNINAMKTAISTVQTSVNTVQTSLNNRINDFNTSLNTRITDLNTSLNRRLNDLPQIAAVAPLPVAANLPPAKLKKIPKPELLTAQRGEKKLKVGGGDYVVLPLQFKVGETATIEWQTMGDPYKNLIDFYLLDAEGSVYRFNRTADYNAIWMAPNDATFYLYFSNTFEPTKPKELWFRLIEPTELK